MDTITATITDLTAGTLTTHPWVLVITDPDGALPDDLPDLEGTTWIEINGGPRPRIEVHDGEDYEYGAVITLDHGVHRSRGDVEVEDVDAVAVSVLTLLGVASGTTRMDGVHVVSYVHQDADTCPAWAEAVRHEMGLPYSQPVGDGSRSVTGGPVPTISQERIIRDLVARYGESVLDAYHAQYVTALAAGGVDGLLAVLSESGAEGLILRSRARAGSGELLREVTRAAGGARRASSVLRQACREAVAYGATKVSVAQAAGVTRPTLDAWLAEQAQA